ncbi:hypothetical protein BASA61_000803 [Batrachochytrium salamandrivorans]|nr:hypothetical protein BASA61_000803 [Batrachochytrium salamandrivorans]
MRFNDFLMFVELHPNESIHFNLCRWMSRIIAVKWLGNRVPYARELDCTIASDGGCPVADGSIHQPSLQDAVSKGTDLTEGTRLCQLGADYLETLRGDQNYLSWTWSAH